MKTMTEHMEHTSSRGATTSTQASQTQPWLAPTPAHPLNATVNVPGSKSLSNRYLILAALSVHETTITGLLRSRDTNLMIEALEQLGVQIKQQSTTATTIHVIPPRAKPSNHFRFHGNTTIFCGLAGTVMRFLPALALFADGPVSFDGDKQAYERPMQPLLDGLEQLGAHIEYAGRTGFLPFTVSAPERFSTHTVCIDSSSSSQFISGLLLAASNIPGGLELRHSGDILPSMPHINMTVADIINAGGHVSVDLQKHTWTVQAAALQLPNNIAVEPDLSNAAPFLGAALLAGGTVRVALWPQTTTQPGGLLPELLSRMGADVTFPVEDGIRYCQVSASGVIHGLGDLDLEAAGELAPSLAALLVCADSETSMLGIAHLRGHETNRLAAMVREIQRIGGHAQELDDGIIIHPTASKYLHAAVIESYNDHRMATFGAMLGLRIAGIKVRNIATTRKTLPDFVAMWKAMLSDSSSHSIDS